MVFASAAANDNSRKVRALLDAWADVHRTTDPQSLWLLPERGETAPELAWFEPRPLAEFTILSSRRVYWDFGVCLIYFAGGAGLDQNELLQATAAPEWTEDVRSFYGFSLDYVRYEQPVWRASALGVFHLTGGISFGMAMMDCLTECSGLTGEQRQRCLKRCLERSNG